MDKALLLAAAVADVKKQVVELQNKASEIQKLEGPSGPQGDKGDQGPKGEQGERGFDGSNGKDGKDGTNGVEGKDGKEGVSVVDAKIDFDGSLVITLSDGREIDAGSLLNNSKEGDTNISVSKWAGYSADELKQTFVYNTFETVNKNLSSLGASLVYNITGDLTSVTYIGGVIKTLTYNGNGDLITVVLSGATPLNITTTKTLTYDVSGNLTNITYS